MKISLLTLLLLTSTYSLASGPPSITLQLPKAFCRGTTLQSNFDGGALIVNPLLAYNGDCWNVGYMYGDPLTAKNAICSYIGLRAYGRQNHVTHAISMAAMDKDGSYQTFDPDPTAKIQHKYEVFTSVLCH